jgi:murein DD-endopeptidase MepM/ murein hydrolase activator NlpD
MVNLGEVLVLDRNKLIRRGASLAVCGTLVIGGLVATAHADDALGRALRERKVTVRKLEILHDFRRVGRQNLHHEIRNLQDRIHRVMAKGPLLASDRQRFNRRDQHLASLRRDLRQKLHKLEHTVRHRTLVLRSQRMDLSTWISTYGIFRSCPVRGPVDVTNNFGYAVPHRPGVPAHIHQGDDMMAAEGQPIVAPFDGIAEAGHNWLGGNAVYVRGPNGYVYNAHLSAYGKLGQVKAGDVIGYVGATGDAGGPHDHFEWHPGNGSAVDPYAYLMAVC